MEFALAILSLMYLAVTGLLIYQQRFYHKQIADLVDRLMCRNLGEYERAKTPVPPRVIVKPDDPLENLDRIIG